MIRRLSRVWSTKLTVSIVVFAASIAFATLALQLEFVTARGHPGPGLFPQLLGAGLVITSFVGLLVDLVAAVKEARSREGSVSAEEVADQRSTFGAGNRQHPKAVLSIVLLTVGFGIAFNLLGAIISSVLYGIACVLLLIGAGRLKAMLIMSVTPVILVILIQVVLRQSLPEGPLGLLPLFG